MNTRRPTDAAGESWRKWGGERPPADPLTVLEDEAAPETDDLWDPLTASWVERPRGTFATGVIYAGLAWFAGLLLGIWFATTVLAAPRAALLPSIPVADAGQLGAPRTLVEAPSRAGSAWAGSIPASLGGAPPLDGPYSRGRTGIIAYATIGGPGYLAIPIGPGHRVRVCAATCLILTSTDAGPNHERLVAGRIADVALGHWRTICGLPAARGICVGTWTLVGPSSTPPATDIGR